MAIVGKISEDMIPLLDKMEKDVKNKKRREAQKLNKDAFLKLMLEQLKNQNPLDPMDNKDMLAQMTQLTTMEQLTNMASQQQKTTKATEDLSKKMDMLIATLATKDNRDIIRELQKLTSLVEGYIKGDGGKADAEALLAEAGAAKPEEPKESKA